MVTPVPVRASSPSGAQLSVALDKSPEPPVFVGEEECWAMSCFFDEILDADRQTYRMDDSREIFSSLPTMQNTTKASQVVRNIFPQSPGGCGPSSTPTEIHSGGDPELG